MIVIDNFIKDKELLTRIDKDETFFGRIMGPIYKMDDTEANNFLKSILFFLWLLVQYRLNRIDLEPLYELRKRFVK